MSGSDEFILVPHNGKSEVWTKFKVVMHNIPNSEDQNSPNHTTTDFVACPLCKELYGKKSSTATLKRHKCTKNTFQNTIEVYGKLTNKKPKILPTRVKDEAIEKCVKYCSLNLRPMIYKSVKLLLNLCKVQEKIVNYLQFWFKQLKQGGIHAYLCYSPFIKLYLK